MLLEEKIAVVTGAKNGIGKAIVELFLKNGADVIGLDVVACESSHPGLWMQQTDVANLQDCEKAYQKIMEEKGHVDVLVNCAGITRDAMTKNMTEQQFDDVIQVNLKGTWNLTKQIGPGMQQQKSGSIINISSIVGSQGNIGQANYAASKAGVVGMTKSWAKEFSLKGGNVRVNAVAPGYTMTDMLKTVPQNLLDRFAAQTMLGRLAQPEEIANVVLFLASDQSSYITGEVIHVNGGMRL